ncbi:hypothetical protein V8J36_02440 [Frigidibacter sp. MR17.14]|uniref:hypothetical protein n=1 Tax=Frigidibacter sp. MR17.14 TaxID=3126509 RepID=UPI0030131DD6
MDDLLALERLLRREAALLLAGELRHLEPIVARKALLLARLDAQPPADARRLARVRALAERNARLLTSALAGVRAVAGTLAAGQRAGTRLESYDALGRSRTISSPLPGLERKA